MGRQGKILLSAVAALLVGTVGVLVTKAEPEFTSREQIADDAAKDIDVMKQGESAGRTMRDRDIRGGVAPPKAVPDEAKCRARWDTSGLEEHYGASRSGRYVTACAQVPYWEGPSGAPAG